MSLLTEDEARQKWCPFARVVPSDASGKVWDGAPAGWNRKGLLANPQPARCLASECTAWRWRDKAGLSPSGEPNYYPGEWKGFCGLAGRPE